MKKISAIIPAYNCENTIKRTIRSIKKQSFEDYEVIIINDGSKDHTLEYIKDEIKDDSRFFLVDINNGGVSNARNIGIKKSRGDYIVFIDSDDWIQNDYFENLIEDMKNTDFLIYSFRTINDKKNKIINYKNEIDDTNCDKKTFFEELQISRLFNSLWNKVFKRELLEEIKFNLETDIGEDFEFVINYYKNIQKYKYRKKSFYNYDLTTGNLGLKNIKDTFEKKSFSLMAQKNFYEINSYDMQFIYKAFVKAYCIDIANLVFFEKAKKDDIYKEQIKCNKIFDFSKIKNLPYNYRLILKIFNGNNIFFIRSSSYFLITIQRIIRKIKFGS